MKGNGPRIFKFDKRFCVIKKIEILLTSVISYPYVISKHHLYCLFNIDLDSIFVNILGVLIDHGLSFLVAYKLSIILLTDFLQWFCFFWFGHFNICERCFFLVSVFMVPSFFLCIPILFIKLMIAGLQSLPNWKFTLQICASLFLSRFRGHRILQGDFRPNWYM